ncbi:O-antigen ligase family protein [Paenibacillus puldeungensis]|uniref:O-antigen ligase family protein n=1 Tax=Paenibacillus puldeungensis TaxID=696536 RepID=A0ABW3RT10_9BACL
MSGLSLVWLVLLVGTAVFFILQCLVVLKMKVDAGYLFAFCIYFDLFGYFYKMVLPGQALLLLIAAPLLPVAVALLHKPTSSWGFLRDQGFWLWGIFLVYALLSLAWAPSESEGLMKEIVLLAHGVVPAIYIYIVYKKYGRFSWNVVAWAGLTYAIAHLLLGVYLEEYPGRLTLPGGNPIFNARASLLTVTVCLWARSIPLPVRVIAAGAAMASALATQSRGPLAAFLIANALFFIVWAVRKYRDKKQSIKLSRFAIPALLLLLMAGAGFSMYGQQLGDWVGGSRFTVLFDRARLQGDDNFIGRVELQLKAAEKLDASPFFGAGLGGVTPPLARDFPHNIIVEMAAELGVVGLAMWTFAVLFSLWAALRYATVLAILLVQCIGYAMLSGDFGFNYEYVVMAFVALALLPERIGKGVATSHENIVSYHRV